MSYNIKTEDGRQIVAGNVDYSEIEELKGEIAQVCTNAEKILETTQTGTFALLNNKKLSDYKLLLLVPNASGQYLNPAILPISVFRVAGSFSSHTNAGGSEFQSDIKYASDTSITVQYSNRVTTIIYGIK